MLETLRRYAKGWVATVFMGLLILSFGIWGIGDIFRGHSDSAAARVGSERVSAQELQQAFQREIATLRERIGPEFDADQARALGLDRRVLAELVRVAAYDLAAHDLGITVPDSVILHRIQSDPMFKSPMGGFDKARFQALLSENGFTEDSFVAALRRDMTRKTLLDLLLAGVPIPDAIAAPMVAYQGEKREAHFVVIPPEKAGAVPPPTEDEIRARYEADKTQLTAPEYRHFTFVDINPADIAKTIQPSDDEIKAHYTQHKSDYAVPEKRQLEQIIFQSQAEAQAAADALKAGKSFSELAATRGLSKGDIELGEKTKASLDPKIADATFAAAAGATAGPLAGPFGWTLLHIVKVTPGEDKSFDEVRARIAADLAKDAAHDKAYKLGTQFEDARTGDAPIEAAAKATGIEALSVAASDSEGRDPKGAVIPALVGKTAILTAAFKTRSGEDSDLASTPEGGYYVVRVDSITPPAERSLDTVRDQIRTTLETEKRGAALIRVAADLAAKGKAGSTIDALASSLGRTAQKSAPLARAEADDTFSAQAIARLFEAPAPGAFAYGPVGKGDGVVLMQLDSVDKPTPEETRAAFGTMKPQIGEVLGDELANVYGESLETRYGVKIDERAVKSAIGGS